MSVYQLMRETESSSLNHGDPESWRAFVAGELPVEQAQALTEHLRACVPCTLLVQKITSRHESDGTVASQDAGGFSTISLTLD